MSCGASAACAAGATSATAKTTEARSSARIATLLQMAKETLVALRLVAELLRRRRGNRLFFFQAEDGIRDRSPSRGLGVLSHTAPPAARRRPAAPAAPPDRRPAPPAGTPDGSRRLP